jgi:hypothetical protein
VVMRPTTSPVPLGARPSIVASVPQPRDPFAGATPMAAAGVPLSGRQSGAGVPEMSPGHFQSAGRLHPLPPLVAVPPAGSGPLPPASVNVSPSVQANAPMSPDANIARHTVVVSHLNGLSEFGSPDAAAAPVTPAAGNTDAGGDNAGAGNYSNNSQAATGPPRIQITVDPSTSRESSNSSGTTLRASSGPASGNGSLSSGENNQQSAFALQQQGNYRQAAAAYQQAIQAYQSQIAAGIDRDAAQRGLQACQTGLEICRESE